jgi:hypothetical protein
MDLKSVAQEHNLFLFSMIATSFCGIVHIYLMIFFWQGLANRTIGSTSMNNESSRSHSVLTFVIESHSKVWCTSQSMLQVLYERAF